MKRGNFMIYQNPVLRGFYPDPSVCCANGKYYMVCSSFQYFPGVPLFESSDLVNWHQIGHCITRKSQISLDRASSSGGIYAATIRYNNGRFYMVTTNVTAEKNFYVWTDDIYGEWSESVFIDRDGIDPSLYFEDGRAYFVSNGTDDNGRSGVVQCEINIETGERLSPCVTIWNGSGGRYLESPHVYKIGGYYYLMAAEGGTEYGHMITCARSKKLWGEYESCPYNPVLTNRNLGGFEIQGVGHGDLVQAPDGSWFAVHLGFRQMGRWMPYHQLGRETFLTPVYFGEDGWFTMGDNGTTVGQFEIGGDFVQERKNLYTFENTEPRREWCFLRHPHEENYELSSRSFVLHGTDETLDSLESPTFIGIRQIDFCAGISAEVEIDSGIAGITLYMDENHHYDLYIEKGDTYRVCKKLNIGDVKSVEEVRNVSGNRVKLVIRADNLNYSFYAVDGDSEYCLGTAQSRYISTEVASGFTGVVIGLFAVGEGGTACFTDFICEYCDTEK